MITEHTAIGQLLERLAAYEPAGWPFVSLYLDLRANQHGRDAFEPFLRKHLPARVATYRPRSPERESLELDVARIQRYIRHDLHASADGAAIFTCAGADVFEAVELGVSIDEHQLYIQLQPHLYPLARVIDQHPPYAVLIADANAARLFVAGLGEPLYRRQITSPTMARTAVGGWSQARYQRHVDHLHLHHVKDVVDALERLARTDTIDKILIAGDPVIVPMVRKALPRHLADRIVEVPGLDMATPEVTVIRATLDVLREDDARDDAAQVERLLHDYRSGGLAVVGLRQTRTALEKGQVDELFVSADARAVRLDDAEEVMSIGPEAAGAARAERTEIETTAAAVNTLIVEAERTAAGVRFIEDGALLAEVRGVGARLRYR